MLTLLFVLTVGATSYFVTRSQITQGVQSALHNHASLLASRLGSALSSVVNTLGELSQNTLILNSLMDSLTRNTSLKPFLADFSTINGIPVAIALTDFEGNTVAGSQLAADMTTQWRAAVLDQGVSYASVERNSSGVFLFVAEPVFYVRTLSPEGALIHQIDLTRLVADFNASGGGGPVQLLQDGKPILEDEQGQVREYDSESVLTQTHQLDVTELLVPLRLAVEVRANPAVVRQPLQKLTMFYGYLGLGLLVAVGVMSTVAARRLAQPLIELQQVAATVVASASFDHRFKAGGYTEVARLGQTFNLMLERLGAAHKQLTTLAHHDALTGLANRALFQSRLRADLCEAQRCEQLAGILLLDVDEFKGINDTLGHPVGDELLKQIAERLRTLVRATDTVARLGGDEFVVIGSHLDNANDAAILGEKIIAATAEPFRIFEHDIFVSASIGIAMSPIDGDDPDELLSNADLALYKAKGEGRGQFQFYDVKLNTAAQKRKRVEASIRAALEQSAFRLHYQPRVDMRTGAIAGVEALVRWQGEKGLVYPNEFVPVAEDSRLIVPLGEWILRDACLQKIAWERAGLPRFSVAINLSAVQLRRDEYVRRLLQIIEKTGVDPIGLEIEITESALMDQVETIAGRLGAFRELGVRLAIDDIGTGYSSLSNLKRLSVDMLKIDRSFIRNLEVDPEDAAITKAITQLGLSLDLTVVAEGVETSGQAEFLQRQGCQQAQGFLYSRAVSAKALAAWLGNGGASGDNRRSAVTQTFSN